MDGISNDKALNGSQPPTGAQADGTATASEVAGSEASGPQSQDALISRRDLVAKIPAVAIGAPLALRDATADASVYNMLFMRGPTSEGGTLWAWGNNDYGQLGVGNTSVRTTPTQIGNLSTWISAANGGSSIGSYCHMLAIRADGTMWACGENQYGQLGNSASADRSNPVQVGTLSNWSQVSCGNHYTVALRADGTIWSWGYNPYGEAGLGLTLGKRSSPVQIGSLSSWVQIESGGSFTIARKSDGTLWSTGDNRNGQLGHGNNIERSSLVQIGNLTTWSSVSASSTTVLAIRTDGTLWSWGAGTYGKLGRGDTISHSSPVQVGSLSSWRQVCAAQARNVALRTDGTLWGFGSNSSGQLGLGDTVSRSSPVQVGTLSTWSTAGGSSHTHWAIRTDGTLWSWGDGADYRLGGGSTADRSSPVQVGSLSSWMSVTGFTSGFAILR